MRKPYPWCSPGVLRNIVSRVFILVLISGLIFSALLSPRFLDVSAQIMSVTSPTQKGGIVVINMNGTVTFFPRVDYTGTDRFSYTISDGEGNSDKAKVTVTVNAPPPTSTTADKQSGPGIQGNPDRGGEINGDESNLQQKNQADDKLAIEMKDQQAFQTGGGVNDTGYNIR